MSKKTTNTKNTKSHTKIKTNEKNVNKIKIIGDNVLYNNGIITAFYLLPLTNYSTASYTGVENSVNKLTNLITNLTTTHTTLTFTIERIEKVIKAKDVLDNLLDTIHIYREDYDMPVEFTKNIQDDRQQYCILGIDIQQTAITDVEDLTITDTAKALVKSAVNTFAGLGNLNVDYEQILKIEDGLYRTLKDNCLRATKELVFYNYISKVYPCYEISYDKLSYINENNFESIMGAVTQTVTDNFGYFEMHNEGVDIFGLEPQTTYGCMIDIKAFPEKINTANFPMDYPNMVTTIQCLKKEDASLRLKRTRSADKYERNQAIEAGAELESIEETQHNIQIATLAIQDIEKGSVLCQFNTSILVWGETLEDLKSEIMSTVNSCKDRDQMLATKSLTQALDFLNNYINKKPKKFEHMTNLSFPLSFQQNSGSNVGDTDDIWSPAIGEDIF